LAEAVQAQHSLLRTAAQGLRLLRLLRLPAFPFRLLPAGLRNMLSRLCPVHLL
jgi:hypothetical protein